MLDNHCGSNARDAGGLMIGGGGEYHHHHAQHDCRQQGDFRWGHRYTASEGHLTIVHSAIVGNQASFTGGGVRIAAGTVTITESTVANNSAGSVGRHRRCFAGNRYGHEQHHRREHYHREEFAAGCRYRW